MNPSTLALVKALLLPPGLVLVLGGVALLAGLRGRRSAMLLSSLALLVLYLLSAPWCAQRLAAVLERREPVLSVEAAASAGAQAIVVPGCDRYARAPEFGRDEVSACTLARLRYAARLHAATGLPLLVSGGTPSGEAIPEAELMARALAEDFHVTARWHETASRNTAENAAYSARILTGEGLSRVLLVTHALHVPRAARAFRQQGLEVVAAPTAFLSVPDHRPAWVRLQPSATALLTSSLACHELLGLAWYAMGGGRPR